MSTGLTPTLPVDANPALVGVGSAPGPAVLQPLASIPAVTGHYLVIAAQSPVEFVTVQFFGVNDGSGAAGIGTIAGTVLGPGTLAISAAYNPGTNSWVFQYSAAIGPAFSWKIVRLA